MVASWSTLASPAPTLTAGTPIHSCSSFPGFLARCHTKAQKLFRTPCPFRRKVLSPWVSFTSALQPPWPWTLSPSAGSAAQPQPGLPGRLPRRAYCLQVPSGEQASQFSVSLQQLLNPFQRDLGLVFRDSQASWAQTCALLIPQTPNWWDFRWVPPH